MLRIHVKRSRQRWNIAVIQYVCVCACVCPGFLLCKWLNWIFVYFRLGMYTFWLNGILFSYFKQTTTRSMMWSLILKYTTNEICLCLHWQWAYILGIFFIFFPAFCTICVQFICRKYEKTCECVCVYIHNSCSSVEQRLV